MSAPQTTVPRGPTLSAGGAETSDAATGDALGNEGGAAGAATGAASAEPGSGAQPEGEAQRETQNSGGYPGGVRQLGRDVVALGKPGITIMCLVMAAGAWALAPGFAGWANLAWTLLGTGLSVVSANAMNMVIEREGDRAMRRTRDRPLPAGRMHPAAALFFSIATGVASFAVLWVMVNTLTAWLALTAIVLYAGVYTPAKRRTPQALAIGAVPGAMPPLLGWAGATGSVDGPAIVLFLILALWQLPHFLAIAIYRHVDYRDAGILTVPVVRGEEAARLQAIVYSLILVPVSLLLLPMGVAGFFYLLVAGGLGAWFFVLSAQGMEPDSGNAWARRFFLASLVYLPALTLGLVVDRLLLLLP